MALMQLIELIQKNMNGDVSIEPLENCTPHGIKVTADSIRAVGQVLHKTEGLYFDMLSCITGVDNGPEEDTMEVIYNLYSIPYDRSLMLKVMLDRKTPELDSVANIWRAADWHEREAFDLLGVVFKGHPDLRRILLPADWEGHPLRKDYEHQEYYRGIRVEY